MSDDIKRSQFKFDESFLKTFEARMKSFDTAMDKLSNIKKLVSVEKAEYGICNCAYKMRYITPSNVSTYVSDLVKAFKTRLFGCDNVCDIEMFTVAMVKRFMEENDCIPFESTSVLSSATYLNPKTTTLQDLIILAENDVYDKQVYSAYEMSERASKMDSDIKRMESMHFSANLKKIVNGLPSILSKEVGMYTQELCDLFIAYIESFLLFACTLNEMTTLFMLSYGLPKATYYKKKPVEKMTDESELDGIIGSHLTIDDSSDLEDPATPDIHGVVTECCLLKTNNMMIHSKIPFNCNMRDVVLQDMHPKFKDTEDALCFIINDARSPIHVLLAKYSDDRGEGFMDGEIANMFIGYDTKSYEVNTIDCHRHSLEAEYKHVDFHTDLSWLDKIAHGNNYLDGNYRNDTPGNHHMHPITNTLNMIYRMYGGCNLKSNKDLANNICRVANTMKRIVRMYPNGGIENWYLVKDILCVLGEILTRNILKLYDNNTQVIAYDDQMDDTMIPGYMYTEGFVMEANDNSNPNAQAPTVTVQNSNSPTNSTAQNIKNNLKQKMSDIARKFYEWVANRLSKFYSEFSKTHAGEISWIKKNTKLNDEITQALKNKTFDPNVTNFPTFDIPINELTTVKIDEVVNKWLNSKDKIDAVAIKKEIYPGGQAIAGQIAAMPDKAKEIAALTNYMLYKKTTPQPGYNGSLSGKPELWEGLVKDLIESLAAIELETKNISNDLKKACEMLQKKMKENEAKKNNENNTDPIDNRAEELFKIVQDVSNTYYTNILNTLRNKFYKVSYKLYRDIVTAYQQQNVNANNSNGQNMQQNQQQQQQNVQQQTTTQVPANNPSATGAKGSAPPAPTGSTSTV